MKKLFYVLAALTLVTACDRVYTVEELKKDKELTKEIMKKCENGEMTSQKEQMSCANAVRVSLGLY